MTSVKLVLSDTFIGGKHSWVALKKSNDIFQLDSFHKDKWIILKGKI